MHEKVWQNWDSLKKSVPKQREGFSRQGPVSQRVWKSKTTLPLAMGHRTFLQRIINSAEKRRWMRKQTPTESEPACGTISNRRSQAWVPSHLPFLHLSFSFLLTLHQVGLCAKYYYIPGLFTLGPHPILLFLAITHLLSHSRYQAPSLESNLINSLDHKISQQKGYLEIIASDTLYQDEATELGWLALGPIAK